MEKLFILLIITFSLTLVGCSGKKTADDSSMGLELTDADEFLEDEVGDVVSEQVPAEEFAQTEEFGQSEQATVADEFSDVPAGGQPEGARVVASGDISQYTVQKNETLMLIAFKLYGDYSKWKELAQLNSGLNVYKLSEGQSLQYYAPVNEFVWSPEGNPYLIKRGDTLGTISNDTYGTQKHWKDIWNNNKPLIRNPNKIYVGFTIYTPSLENREVASQQ